MTVTAADDRRSAGRRAPLVAAALALLTVLPVGVLFLAQWRDLDERVTSATLERDGIAYISTLTELTVAVADAQSAAINGRAIPRHTLSRAIAATDEVDASLGPALRVGERWQQLRDDIERLAVAPPTDPRSAYLAYTEVTDLLLALYQKLRETSGLIRVGDADTYYLQDGAAEELPEALVAASRLVDVVAVAAAEAQVEPDDPSAAGQVPPDTSGSEPGTDPGQLVEQAARQRAAFVAEVSVARVGLASPADDLTRDILAALDSTQSRTLSSNVLRSFDRFLQEKDGLLMLVTPAVDPGAVDLEALDRLRVDLHTAASDLFHALIAELDSLITTRIDGLERQRWTAAGLAAAVLLLLLAVAWAGLAGARSPRRRRAGEARRQAERPGGVSLGRPGPEPAEVVQAELVEWERSGVR